MLGDSAVLGTGGGGSSGDAVAAVAAEAAAAAGALVAGGGAHDGADTVAGSGGGGGGSNSGDDERGRGEEGDRSFGGNRWPRQETLALLKIRSDMDVAFRDASVKGPLWEEVSRKLAEHGYHRNAKKCKEKFENVYKYHKRTKEGRSGKSDGKTYRFFDQLEALEGNHPAATQSPTSSKPPQTAPLQATPVSIVVTTTSLPLPTTAATTTKTTVPMPSATNTTPSSVPPSHATTLPSTTTLPMSMPQGILNTTTTTTSTTPSINLTIPTYLPPSNPTYFPPSSTANPTSNPPHTITPPSFPNIPTDLLSNSSSSSTSSDETFEGRRKRKRKWKDFFERLMKEVIEKQEKLQKRFLEAIEKREHERAAREEAWRMQEMQRINREREILAQERSIAAAKDAAVMAFLQKIAEQQNLGTALNNITVPQQHASLATTPASASAPPLVPAPTPTPTPTSTVQQPSPVSQAAPVAPAPQAQPVVSLAPQQQQHHQVQVQVQQQPQPQVTNMEIVKADNGENLMPASSSRWPKVEVQALIKLRTSLDTKYQENGPKGPLWEEISTLMRKIGYNRSAKRCKEKWENINKYFKKVKESNKKRPEDSKTCPYFHQLDALYKEKNKLESPLKPESMMEPLMVLPEQQWPLQQEAAALLLTGPEVTMEDVQNDPMDRRHHEEEEDDDEDDDDDDDEKDVGDEDEDEDEDDEGGGNNYEIVASKPASVGASAE